MEHYSKNFFAIGELKYTIENRKSGEVVIFTQNITSSDSKNSKLKSRECTTMKDNINLKEVEDYKIVEVTSNRPIGILASSKDFEEKVKSQQMFTKGKPIVNSKKEQLYHLFVLSPDAKDVYLDYSPTEKIEELIKANQILDITS